MELPVKEHIKIEDGAHTGVIIEVEYRESPYRYTDVWIEFNQGQRIKYGVPTPTELTTKNKLGKLLQSFGAVMEVGKSYDPAKVLIGKKCIFMTTSDEESQYSRILDGTLKPLNNDDN